MYIDVCTGVRCKVCDERGRGEGVSMSAAVKVKSLNPLAEVGGEGGGAQPIMNDQETILIVQKFNTRGLALGKIKLISLLCMVHRKNIKKTIKIFSF